MLSAQAENPISSAKEMCPKISGKGTEGGLGSLGKTTGPGCGQSGRGRAVCVA